MTKEDAVRLANLAMLILEYKAYMYTRPQLWLTFTFEQWLERKVAREEVVAKAERND